MVATYRVVAVPLLPASTAGAFIFCPHPAFIRPLPPLFGAFYGEGLLLSETKQFQRTHKVQQLTSPKKQGILRGTVYYRVLTLLMPWLCANLSAPSPTMTL